MLTLDIISERNELWYEDQLKRSEGITIDLIEAKAIFLLSLWKTYVGPALGVGFEMSYLEAVSYTMLGAIVSVYTTLYFERYVTRFVKWVTALVLRKKQNKSPGFKPKLRKAVRFYRRYGFWGLMALTPILIGLPVGVWIAVRMGSSKVIVGATTLSMSLFWSTISYLVAFNSLDQLPL